MSKLTKYRKGDRNALYTAFGSLAIVVLLVGLVS